MNPVRYTQKVTFLNKRSYTEAVNTLLTVFIMNTMLFGCGSQDRAKIDPLTIAKQATTTDAYSDLNSLFLAEDHPVGTFVNLTGSTGSGTFEFPALPDFNTTANKTAIVNYINLNAAYQVNYTTTLSPGWLYQILVADANTQTANNKQYFTLTIETERNSLEINNIKEFYTFYVRQMHQPNATETVLAYLYFPETVACSASQSCTQTINMSISLDPIAGLYNEAAQFHYLEIDAIAVSETQAMLSGDYFGITKNFYKTTKSNPENQVTVSQETENPALIDNQKVHYILINDVLFKRFLSPTRYSKTLNSDEVYQNHNPAPFWFVTAYKVNTESNGYYYQYSRSNIPVTFSNSLGQRLTGNASLQNVGSIYPAADGLNWNIKQHLNFQIKTLFPKECGDDCNITENSIIETQLTLSP